MTFIQLIEFESDRDSDIEALVDEWRDATEGRRSTASAVVCRDREHSDRYVTIVEFPSYEAAMENSELPETQRMSARMAQLCKSAPRFVNLDEIRRDKS